VSVSGSGVIDVSAWDADDSITVHLVNLTNPMMMRGPIRELYPVGPLEVTVRHGRERAPGEVRLLVSGTTAAANVADRSVSFSIPSIADHEVAALVF
jgi:hypothetical protein